MYPVLLLWYARCHRDSAEGPKFSQVVSQHWEFSGDTVDPRGVGYFSDPLSTFTIRPLRFNLPGLLFSANEYQEDSAIIQCEVSRVSGGAVHTTSEVLTVLVSGNWPGHVFKITASTTTVTHLFLYLFFFFFSKLRNTATIKDTFWMKITLLPALILVMGWGENYSPKILNIRHHFIT